MPNDSPKLSVDLEARITDFEKQLKRAQATADKQFSAIEKRGAAMTANLKGLGGGVGDAFGGLKAGALAALAPVALLTEGIAGAKKALADFGKIADDIKPTGLSSDLYQGFALGAKEAGVDVDSLNASLDIFAKNAGLAADGTGPLISGLKTLNPELLKAILSAKTQDERLRLVADAMDRTGSAAGKAALSAVVFGKSGVKLVDAFTGGSKALDGFIARGKELGIVISQDMLDSTDALSDKLDTLSFAIDTNLNKALINLAPLLVDATTEVAHLTKGVADFTAQPSFETFVKMLELTNPKIVEAAQGVDTLVEAMARGTPEAAKLAGAISQALSEIPRRLITDDQLATLDSLKARLGESGDGAQSVKDELDKLAAANPKFQQLADQLNPLLDKLIAIQKQAGATGAALSGVGGPSFREAENQSMTDLKSGVDTTRKVLTDREAESKKSEFEKQVEKRADDIVKGVEEAGGIITRGIAMARAKVEIDNESAAKSSSASVSSSAELIKQFEGFISKAKFDVNAYRAGFGSDTVTLSDGSIQKVTAGMTVTLSDANRDLARRIAEFQDGIKGQIGADTFNAMDGGQQDALTSLAYNYGSLPQRIVDAIKTGNQATVVSAIRGLGTDNGGINKARRNQEADTYLSGAPAGVQAQVAGQDNYKATLADVQKRIDAIKAEATAQAGLNPLINDYGYAVTKAQVAQDLLNDAQKNGIEITPELRAQIDALAGKYAAASSGAEQLASSQSTLTQRMQESSAFGKDVLGGFIRDLKDGKSATEALSNALEKVADKLLEVGLNAIFDGGGTPGGDVLGTVGALRLCAVNDNQPIRMAV